GVAGRLREDQELRGQGHGPHHLRHDRPAGRALGERARCQGVTEIAAAADVDRGRSERVPVELDLLVASAIGPECHFPGAARERIGVLAYFYFTDGPDALILGVMPRRQARAILLAVRELQAALPDPLIQLAGLGRPFTS